MSPKYVKGHPYDKPRSCVFFSSLVPVTVRLPLS